MGTYNKKPEYDVEDLGLNNFTDLRVFKIATVRKVIANQFVMKGDGDLVPAVREMEYNEYTKLFTNATNRKRLNDLTLRGKEMLLWIMYTIKSGEDHIWINRDRYMKEMGINSNTTILATIKDLMKYSIIAPTGQAKDTYWINPNIFFKGDRLTKFKANIDKDLSYDYTEEARDLMDAERMFNKSID